MPTKNPLPSFSADLRRLFGFALAVSFLWSGPTGLCADSVPQPISLKLLVAPSSSKLAGGTVKLNVDVLSRNGAAYVGGYELKVFPYFFMNESGQFQIDISEPQVQKMLEGGLISLSGHAQAKGSEVIHKITAKATPGGNGHGALTFTVATDNGPLVFTTSYQMVAP